MRLLRRCVFLLGLAMWVPSPSGATEDPAGVYPFCYLWQLSFSPSDPTITTTEPAAGPVEVYLWLLATLFEGMTGAEMTVNSSPGLQLLGFIPMNGFQNAGDAGHLQLNVGGCPMGPIVAGRFTFWDATGLGGEACLGDPLGGSGPIDTADCSGPQPTTWPSAYGGCSSDPAVEPCFRGIDCPIWVPVEPPTWGRVKSMYR